MLLASAFAVELKLPENSPQLIAQGISAQTVTVECSGELEGVSLTAELRHYAGREVKYRARTEAAAESKLTFQSVRTGYYDLVILARKGEETLARLESNFAVVPAAAYPRPAEMGVCVHFMQKKHKAGLETTLELIRLAGFSRIREDLSWPAIERKAGEYQLPEPFVQLIDTVPRFGLKPLIVTGYNNPVYGKHFKKAFPTTPEMYEAYGNAVAWAVRECGDRVTEWELWNEPNSAHPVNDYLPMLQTVYPKVKAANPKATFISCGGGGAGGGPGGGMIVPIVKAGGVEFQDGFSIHPYMTPHDPDFGYKSSGGPIPAVSIPEFTRYLRTLQERNPKKDGSKLAFYITELGWPVESESLRPVPVTQAAQAAYVARTFLLNRAFGNQVLFWYDFQNDGDDPLNPEHNFGLLRRDYSPKPSYQAAAVAASLLRNRPFQKAITADKVRGGDKDALAKGLCKLYIYGNADSRFIALWSAELSNNKYFVEFQLPFAYEKAQLLDWQGAELKMPKKLEGNRIELQLTMLVQYIIQR